MKDLIDKVVTRASNLTSQLLYPREGSQDVTFSFHRNVMPPRNTPELAPFCFVYPGRGSYGHHLEREIVALFCFREEDRNLALVKLDHLVSALRLMAHPGGWSPWVQQTVKDSFGDGEHGLQPHPIYIYTITMQFKSNETLQYTPWRD